MTTKEFFTGLLTSQALSKEQNEELTKHREEVEGFLREKFGDAPKIKYAGSKAKGTMISDSYDLDIICYFPSDDTRTLEELRTEVNKTLSEEYIVKPKTTALRIMKKGEESETDYHIDIVPGRFLDESEEDAYLYVAYGDKKRMKTNIEIHIAHIKESGLQETFKLLKLWKVRNDVPVKTFILEILTVKLLKDVDHKDDHAKNIKIVLEALRDSITTMRLEDPANSGNIVTEGMESSEKNAVESKAKLAIEQLENSEDELDAWRGVFIGDDEETAKEIKQGSFYAAGGSAIAGTTDNSHGERKITSPNSWGI